MAGGVSRGDIWTVAGGPEYTGKPRPAVILQDDAFEGIPSITVCLITTLLRDASLLRLTVEPGPGNGLRRPSQVMVDKIVTVPRQKLGTRIGRLADADIVRLNAAVVVFLGLAARPSS
jgi:mRNA interferase MazF